MTLHHLPEPTECLLWHEPQRLGEMSFETVTVFDDDYQLRRRLVKCPECGQLYFYETREETEIARSDDPTVRLYIPVPTGEHAAALSLASSQSLTRVRPQLRYDWPSDQAGPTMSWWRGKTEP